MKIKIFGERNTSTNALSQLIKSNSSSLVFPGTVIELDLKAAEQLSVERLKGASKQTLENLTDQVFSQRLLEQQWKHCATLFDSIEIPSHTHFIFTIRHPLSWLVSLYKNPYHSLITLPGTLAAFSQCQWKTVKRERLEQASFTPLELYERKLQSYLAFMKRLEAEGSSYSVLKFEDLILKQEACFEKIAPNLDQASESFQVLTTATKRSGKDLDHYKEYYGKELWKQEIDPQFLREFRFNAQLLEWMGYTI